MVQSQPTQTKSVVVLSAADDAAFGSATELTRFGDGDDKHGFTLKIRDTPPASAPSATTAAVDVDEEELLLRPRHGRRLGVVLVGLLLLVVGVALFSRGPIGAGRGETPALGASAPRAASVASPDPAAASAAAALSSAGAGEPTLAEIPAGEKPAPKTSAAAVSGTRKGEGHARAKENGAKEVASREMAAPAAQGSTCRGQLHLYATHGWLLSGGPGSVQAPGRYDWPCGTYGLKAVSRLDPGDVRSMSVTIREGTPGVVDLR
jgi:hypothetical protein